MRIIINLLFIAGIICFLLNSMVYLFPSEVADPPIEPSDKILFYLALHSLFIIGSALFIVAYLINKKRKYKLMKDEINLMIDGL